MNSKTEINFRGPGLFTLSMLSTASDWKIRTDGLDAEGSYGKVTAARTAGLSTADLVGKEPSPAVKQIALDLLQTITQEPEAVSNLTKRITSLEVDDFQVTLNAKSPSNLSSDSPALADLTACALELDIMGERTADAEAQAAGSYVGLVELMALQLSDYTTLRTAAGGLGTHDDKIIAVQTSDRVRQAIHNVSTKVGLEGIRSLTFLTDILLSCEAPMNAKLDWSGKPTHDGENWQQLSDPIPLNFYLMLCTKSIDHRRRAQAQAAAARVAP